MDRSPGQPSKGPRRAITTRVPGPHYDVYTEAAQRHGMQRSDYIAWFLAQGHGLDDPAWMQRDKNQDPLPELSEDDDHDDERASTRLSA